MKVRAVEKSAASSGARFSGSVTAASRVDLAFRLGGYVQDVATVPGVDGKPRPLQEGDRVTRGMDLASLRKADYAQKLGEAKAALAEAVAAKEQAQIDHDRATKLGSAESIAQSQVDAARVRLDGAVARVDGCRVRVNEAQMALADTVLRAPMDGVVLRRAVEVGALASPGAPVISIADTSSVKVVFGVPDTVLEALKLGATQAITLEAYKGVEFTGRVTRIAQFADVRSHSFDVEVTIPNDDGQLKAGMIASLKLSDAAAAAPPSAVLPLTAIIRSPHAKAGDAKDKNRFAVLVLDETKQPPVARARDVELGEFLGNQIPIKSGITGGEKVIVMGATLVSDGESVQVIP